MHMFTTPRPTLTLQLHNFDLFRTCRTALLCGSWQDFNGHDLSRGPSAIAELLVTKDDRFAANTVSTSRPKKLGNGASFSTSRGGVPLNLSTGP